MSAFQRARLTFISDNIPGGRYELPIEPLISVQHKKVLVETPIPGRRGAVVEIISADNHRIDVTGIIRSEPIDGIESDEYPTEAVKSLQNLVRLNEALEVECELLATWGIARVVIEDLSLPAEPGSENEQAYRLRMISEEPVELEILNL